ncbi:NAD-dependent epimerase/dehydratase family protein [Quadrisphaera sp. DSM 44207]|uniref:NAD-dependent epimerase/dehydratase family protein n=1 Tax=Quadrisphaera sp. DSM 44207 TaxID=1881057 RepID=UPI00088B801C|nr:NAD-dependent epimerase/dehydratase family protein [Quadrisphaera sp. DSM 44207]SDQ08163.1 Nucleoside-diphosphate-sugar epimerase [Quadrisphaera sp. DSM 44207]
MVGRRPGDDAPPAGPAAPGARDAADAAVVAVTGTGPGAEAVVRALAAAEDVGRVVAVRPQDAGPGGGPDGSPGDQPGAGPGVTAASGDVRRVAADLTSPAVVEALRGADVVVHVAADTDLAAVLGLGHAERRRRVVATAQAVVTAAAAAGARRLVAVTSAMVHGASPDAPIPLPEDAPLLAAPDDGTVGDLLAVEEVLERARGAHPGLRVAVLRPAALAGPGVDTVITRHFEAPRLLTLRDSPSVWQFCHVQDLASAVVTAVRADLSGPLTVGSTGVMTQAVLERSSGMRRVELPSRLALATAERLQRAGVLPMPAGDLAYVVHPWVVSSRRLLEAGWRPEHDNEDCLREVLESARARRAAAAGGHGARDAALGAAGAAVALVGTAALVRQTRARRARP